MVPKAPVIFAITRSSWSVFILAVMVALGQKLFMLLVSALHAGLINEKMREAINLYCPNLQNTDYCLMSDKL